MKFNQADSGRKERALNAANRNLKATGMTRRAFMRIAPRSVAAGVLTTGALSILADITSLGTFVSDILDFGKNSEPLRRMLGLRADRSVALIPAANHPWKPLDDEKSWYPIEQKCCDAFRASFAAHAEIRKIKNYPEARANDNLVLFGSSVSNIVARDVLGNPWQQPRFELERARWRTRLRWNISSPLGKTDQSIHRQQYGDLWKSGKHAIVDKDGGATFATGWDTESITDFLLVTSLPRLMSPDRRVTIFAGLHGPGTAASEILLGKSGDSCVREIGELTEESPYFQALVEVRARKSKQNEYVPERIKVLDAIPLRVNFRRT